MAAAPSMTITGREIGWFPGVSHLAWAALGALAGSVIVGIPMASTGAMTGTVAALVGSDSLAVGWAIHLAAGVLFGTPFGLFVWTRNLWKGLIFGAAWGLLVGVLFAWLATWTLLGRPIVAGEPAANLDVALHVLWGAILGLVYAAGLMRSRAGDGRARRTTRAKPV
jgi:hypothetical protein